MKFLQLSLLLVGLMTTGGLLAATPTVTTKTAKARAAEYAKKHKQNVIKNKKQTPAKKETPKAAALDRATQAKKGKWQKLEPKQHIKGSRKPVVKSTAKDRPAVATTAPTAKAPESTVTDKVIDWLGWGAAGTAATKAYTQRKTAGYHIGPRNWHHNFGAGWGDRGWVEGTNEHGHWVFAGYRPDWWRDQPEYSSYYHNVILPLYRKTTEYHRTVGK